MRPRLFGPHVISLLATVASTPAFAQQSEQPKEPLENCGSLPYSVRTSNAGGEIQSKVTSDALTGLLSRFKSGTGGTIGAEYMAAAIADSSAGAFSRVINYYRCVSRNRLVDKVNSGTMLPEHLEDFDNRVAVLMELIDDAQAAAIAEESETAAVNAVLAIRSGTPERIRTALATPVNLAFRSQVTAAMAGIAPDDFTRLSSTVGWAKLETPFATVGACGGVIKRVLERSSGNLQGALSTTPALFLAYFQPSSTAAASRSASLLANYAALIRLAPPQAEIPELTPAFRNCSSKLLRRVDPQAAAVIEATTAETSTGVTSANPEAPGGPPTPPEAATSSPPPPALPAGTAPQAGANGPNAAGSATPPAELGRAPQSNNAGPDAQTQSHRT